MMTVAVAGLSIDDQRDVDAHSVFGGKRFTQQFKITFELSWSHACCEKKSKSEIPVSEGHW